MEIPAVLSRYREAIDRELREILAQRSGLLYNMMQYQLGWTDEQGAPVEGAGGKRLRPGLCLLTCEALCGDFSPSLPSAAAVELVHNFSLVHDDVQDGTPQRHQRPTLWWRWGPAQAINAGDGLHALGRLALLRLKNSGFDHSRVITAMHLLDEACLRLCEGQHMDLDFQERLDVTIDAYLKMVAGKTGALMSCAMQLGALAATEDERVLQALAQCGLHLGTAYQIRDDILDLWGESLAEVSGGDLLTKKKSFPIVFALEKGDFKLKRELGAIYFKRVLNIEDVKKILTLLESVEARQNSESLAQHYCQQAMEALKDVEMSPQGREEITNVASFMIQRHS